jgi:hypothetical protein
MKEKSKIYNIQGKNTNSPSNQTNHKLLLKPSHEDGNTKFQLKRVVRKA